MEEILRAHKASIYKRQGNYKSIKPKKGNVDGNRPRALTEPTNYYERSWTCCSWKMKAKGRSDGKKLDKQK